MTLVNAQVGLILADKCRLEGAALVATHAWMVRVVVEAALRGDVPRVTPRREAARSRPKR